MAGRSPPDPDPVGIDLGRREHWVCGPPREDEKPNVRTFRTTTGQLRELADWLAAEGVESVAMESTYVYWVPLHELLEERGFEVLLVNARQLQNEVATEWWTVEVAADATTKQLCAVAVGGAVEHFAQAQHPAHVKVSVC